MRLLVSRGCLHLPSLFSSRRRIVPKKIGCRDLVVLVDDLAMPLPSASYVCIQQNFCIPRNVVERADAFNEIDGELAKVRRGTGHDLGVKSSGYV